MTSNGNYPPGMTRRDWAHVNGECLGDAPDDIEDVEIKPEVLAKNPAMEEAVSRWINQQKEKV